MDKKQFLMMGLVVIVLLVATAALSVLGHVHTSTPNNAIATSAQTPDRTSGQPPIHQVQVWGQYTINAPDALMLVDSQGRRTGKDPRTGNLYREIPNTGYQELASTNSGGGFFDELTLANLPKGQYTLYVLGAQTGPYAVDIANNQGQSPLEGTVQAGSMMAYTQNYDPTNLASSTFSFAANISSTASITSAPPNNLPRPLSP